MLLTAVSFFVILSILVLVHELGHFTVARWVGVDVEEFGLGLPPRIVGKKIGNTIYSLNWLPIGGFVKLRGEDEEELASKVREKDRPRYFWARSKTERSMILTAGVAMNFLLATVITSGLLMSGVEEPSGQVHIETVVAGSPAETAGLRPDDVVRTISYTDPDTGGEVTKVITVPKDLVDITRTQLGQPLTLAIERDGAVTDVVVTPRTEFPEGQGPMGVSISDLRTVKYPWYEAPYRAVILNLRIAWQMVTSVGQFLWKLVTFSRVENYDVAGPIGIAQVTGKAVEIGFRATLEFMSLLSLNLAVLNILPFPALDGGRLLFVFLEKVMGRKVRPAFERSAHQIGMILLFALILAISVNDVLRLARGGGM